MGNGNDYYGYNSAFNDKLTELRKLGRHTHENFTKYDTSDGDSHFDQYQPTYKLQGSDPGGRPSQANYDYRNKKDAYGRTGMSGSGVEAIYQRLMAQDPDKVQALIQHWEGIAKALGEVIHEIRTKSDGMSKSWVSPGAKQFLALGPGAAMKSVSDWQLSATNTATGLKHLHEDLVAQQAKIQQLYQQYTAEVGAYQAKIQNWKTGKAGITGAQDLKNMPGHGEEIYTKKIAEVQSKYTWQAQVIESNLADAYWDSYNAVVGSTPGIYEGPTNAVVAPPALFVTPPNVPGGKPGGPPPPVLPGALSVHAPTAPGGKPGGPNAPVKPSVKAPVAPNAPLAPVAPNAPVPPAAPSILPVVPAGASALTKPNITKPNAPTAPTAPGSGPNPSLPTSPGGLSKALAKGVLKPSAAEAPDLPSSPNRGGRLPSNPAAGARKAKRPTSSVLRPSADEPDLPPSAGQGRRPSAPGSQGKGRAGGRGNPSGVGAPELPGSPFPGRTASVTPSVLGGRTTPRAPAAGQGRVGTPAELPPLPPGATRSVLNRPDPALQRGKDERSRVGRESSPGGLVGPLALGPLTLPTNPVLNRPTLAGRPASNRALGVPEGLRGATRPGEQAPARGARPVARPDLAARRANTMPAVEPELAEERRLNDVDAFNPETPGGPVLTQSNTETTHEPGPRIALPGSG
jgi:hypothetical protein